MKFSLTRPAVLRLAIDLAAWARMGNFAAIMTTYNNMQQIKRRIFAMRNGIVADALRKAGSPYRYIMGVNLPQLKEIASEYGTDAALADELIADTLSRESQLIAPMLMPRGEVDADRAENWLRGLKSREAVDVLCHSLLRHEPYAFALARKMLAGDDVESRYAGLRLLWNLVNTRAAEILPVAESEATRGDDASLKTLAERLAEEARFMLGL